MFRFRPHHLVCSLCYEGKGYDRAFVENFTAIYNLITNRPNEKLIAIVEDVDDICKCCPHNINGCIDEEKTKKMDAQYFSLLKLEYGAIISWQDLKGKIKQYLTLKTFDVICKDCSWKASNICSNKLVLHYGK